MEYLYHCAGCKKPDKEYPDKKQECEECGGTGLEDENGFQDDCWKCGEYIQYTDLNNFCPECLTQQ